MMTGQIDECRQAAELIALKHAAVNGYTPTRTVEEPQDDGSYILKWTTPTGEKHGVAYRADQAA